MYRGIITISSVIGELSETGDCVPRPISATEQALLDSKSAMVITVTGTDNVDCINKITEQIERISELYRGKNG